MDTVIHKHGQLRGQPVTEIDLELDAEAQAELTFESTAMCAVVDYDERIAESYYCELLKHLHLRSVPSMMNVDAGAEPPRRPEFAHKQFREAFSGLSIRFRYPGATINPEWLKEATELVWFCEHMEDFETYLEEVSAVVHRFGIHHHLTGLPVFVVPIDQTHVDGLTSLVTQIELPWSGILTLEI